MKLLDTSILIRILRGDETVRALLNELEGEELCTTTLTQFELLSRAYHRGLTKEAGVIRRLLRSLNLLLLDAGASERASQIMGSLLRAGRPVNAIDVLIAGIALDQEVNELITCDNDFKIIERVHGAPKVVLLPSSKK
jgi:hypothetical protein